MAMEVETNAALKEVTFGNVAMGKVKRPMNAFLIFCKKHRASVQEKNPQLDNRSVTRLLADMWANMDTNDKADYKNSAKQDREAFLKAHPDFKWHNSDKQAVAVGGRSFSESVLSPKNQFSTVEASACISDTTSSRPLSLLCIAGQQALTQQAQNRYQFQAYDADMHCDESPIDLSQSSVAETVSEVRADFSYIKPVHQLCESRTMLLPVNSLPSISKTPRTSQPSSSDSSSCVSHRQLDSLPTASITLPEHGISTYHLVSTIFDSLINSVYGLQPATAASVSSNDVLSDSPSKVKLPSVEYDCATFSSSLSSKDDCASKIQFPMTKKQMAVQKCNNDVQMLTSRPDAGENLAEESCGKTEFETLTLGELQEKLITKVVENCSISRLLELGSDSRPLNSVAYNINQKQLPTIAVHAPVNVLPKSSLQDKSACNKTVISSWRDGLRSQKSTSAVLQDFAAMDSRKLANLLELRPLLTQSDVHKFIERVITEKSIDFDDFCMSSNHGSVSSCMPANLIKNVCEEHNGEDSIVSESKSCDSQLVVDPVNVGARQTLQEISPNKRSVSCFQYHADVGHCKEDQQADVGASHLKVCKPSQNEIIPQSLVVESTSNRRSEYVDYLDIDNSGEKLRKQNFCSEEINNNHHTLPLHTVNPNSGLRKSKRCNRGQRYQELVLKGVLHQTRKKADIIDLSIAPQTEPVAHCFQAVSSENCTELKISPTDMDASRKRSCASSDCTSFSMTSQTDKSGGLNVCEMWSVMRQRSAYSSSSSSADQSIGSRKRKPSKSHIVQYTTVSNHSHSTVCDEPIHDSSERQDKRLKSTAEMIPDKHHSSTVNSEMMSTVLLSSTGAIAMPIYRCGDLAALADVAIATKQSSQNACF